MYRIRTVVIVFVVSFIISSCNSKISYVDDSQFVGNWKCVGAGNLYEGLEIEIRKQGDVIKGYVVHAPDNKYGDLFVSLEDVWLKDFQRTSNFQFKWKENRIAGELLSSYGMSSIQEYKVQFISKDTIGVSSSSLSPIKSSRLYVRIK